MEFYFAYKTIRLKTYRVGDWRTEVTQDGEVEILEEYPSMFKAFMGHRFWKSIVKKGEW